MSTQSPIWFSRQAPVLRREVVLPASKSLSNRALLLCALSGKESKVSRVSHCDDTNVMETALRDRPATVDIMAAGTAMRFLTAYFATQVGETHVMTGTTRMKHRPIAVLVEALRSLGATIDYEAEEGFPPLRIIGCPLEGGLLELPANVSSQYISALLMVAPLMRQGLQLRLVGEVLSRPYIEMTIALMQRFGAKVAWKEGQSIEVQAGAYTEGIAFEVESDWTAASYWYELVALSPDTKAWIHLPFLYRDSLQGDHHIARYFTQLGVETLWDEDGRGLTLRKAPEKALAEGERFEANLSGQPDVAQTLAVCCAMTSRPFRLTGLRTLRIKETDRIAALAAEFQKFGLALEIEGDEAIGISHYPFRMEYDGRPIETYDDHRMAMAFAPATLLFPTLQIAHPEVVTKSYPLFWEQLAAQA